MAVRPFWIEAVIDGRATKLAGGPRSADGGMAVTLCVRDQGASRRAVHINCVKRVSDGALVIEISNLYANTGSDQTITVLP